MEENASQNAAVVGELFPDDSDLEDSNYDEEGAFFSFVFLLFSQGGGEFDEVDLAQYERRVYNLPPIAEIMDDAADHSARFEFWRFFFFFPHARQGWWTFMCSCMGATAKRKGKMLRRRKL